MPPTTPATPSAIPIHGTSTIAKPAPSKIATNGHVGPFGRHPHARLDGPLDIVEQDAAVGEGIGGDIEDAHHQGSRAKLERFPVRERNRIGTARRDHLEI